MSYYHEKTPPLGACLTQRVMRHFLTQVKRQRGLTTFIERHGVNGKYLKPDTPYDIRITKFLRIMETKALYQTDEEFLDDWNDFGKDFLAVVRTVDDARKPLKDDI